MDFLRDFETIKLIERPGQSGLQCTNKINYLFLINRRGTVWEENVILHIIGQIYSKFGDSKRVGFWATGVRCIGYNGFSVAVSITIHGYMCRKLEKSDKIS